jgi:hypothetical protein
MCRRLTLENCICLSYSHGFSGIERSRTENLEQTDAAICFCLGETVTAPGAATCTAAQSRRPSG